MIIVEISRTLHDPSSECNRLFSAIDTERHNDPSCGHDEMSKAARVWILILGAGLVAGVAGITQDGWQHPGDTIGATVWLALALSTALTIRCQSRNRP
jgi:hypothetical protein